MIDKSMTGELVGEFAGSLILILVGCGVVAQVVTTGGTSAPAGGHDAIAWAWGIGVALAVYVSAKLSGAHLNPAITVALTVFRDFPREKVWPYVGAQFAGCFVGAILVRMGYADLIGAVDPALNKTQGIFSTLPGNGIYHVTIANAFLDQVIGTALLVFVVFAITSTRNDAPPAWLAPLVVGLLIVAIGMAWGANAGYAINPARDFGPRMASLLTGYHGALTDQHGQLYFVVPLIAPMIGGLLGGWLFTELEKLLPRPLLALGTGDDTPDGAPRAPRRPSPTPLPAGPIPAARRSGDTPLPRKRSGDTPLPGRAKGDTPLPGRAKGDTPLPRRSGDTPLPRRAKGDTPLPGRVLVTPPPRVVDEERAARRRDRTPLPARSSETPPPQSTPVPLEAPQQPFDQQPVEQQPVEQQPVDQQLVDQQPVEREVVDQQVDQQLVDPRPSPADDVEPDPNPTPAPEHLPAEGATRTSSRGLPLRARTPEPGTRGAAGNRSTTSSAAGERSPRRHEILAPVRRPAAPGPGVDDD